MTEVALINQAALVNKPLQPRELIALAIEWLAAGKQIALVTLVHIEGNAPYPVGSQMLVDQEGVFIGQITGGCAETAIADQAVAAMKIGKNSIQRYGLDSPYFDIQLPCGSGIDVVFDVALSRAELESILQKLNARQTCARPIALSTFTKVYRPNERLVLFGQGPIVSSLGTLAVQSGFEVMCYAQNQETHELLSEVGLAAADLQTQEFGFTDVCDAHSALVSLFHEHDLETSILARALQTDLFYVGALGSKRTHANRLDSLRAYGVAENLLANIHGPVGLDIGANTPAQIAISILSEIIAVLNRRESV